MAILTGEHLDTVTRLIREHLEIPIETLPSDGLFVQDFGADSLGLLDLLAALEKEADVIIDDSRCPELVSLDGVCTVMADVAGW